MDRTKKHLTHSLASREASILESKRPREGEIRESQSRAFQKIYYPHSHEVSKVFSADDVIELNEAVLRGHTTLSRRRVLIEKIGNTLPPRQSDIISIENPISKQQDATPDKPVEPEHPNEVDFLPEEPKPVSSTYPYSWEDNELEILAAKNRLKNGSIKSKRFRQLLKRLGQTDTKYWMDELGL